MESQEFMNIMFHKKNRLKSNNFFSIVWDFKFAKLQSFLNYNVDVNSRSKH